MPYQNTNKLARGTFRPNRNFQRGHSNPNFRRGHPNRNFQRGHANENFQRGRFNYQRGRPNYQRGPSEQNYHTYQNRNNQPNIYSKEDQLSETEVGISEFVHQSDGFHAIIKARFSDFHVNEINLDNEIAKLDNTKVPIEFHAKAVEEDPACPTELIPADTWTDIKNLCKSDEKLEVTLDVTDLTKEERRAIHVAISKAPIGRVVTQTVSKDDKKFVTVKKFDKHDMVDQRGTWPSGLAQYVHFLVHKEAMDTLEVCMLLSDCMKMAPSAFTYAGVKDKRAKTTQWFSVRKVHPFKLLRRTDSIKKLRIGNFRFKEEPLKLGQLSGNRFRIALRNVKASDQMIEELLEALKMHGFINYYGLQRFGNDKEVPTYEIGKQLLLGNWKEACALILKPKKSDNPYCEITMAKRTYSATQDPERACECLNFRRNTCLEAKLLNGLASNHANDYVTALEFIPRNMRLLYIHSFQSYVWNKMASIRFQRFGAKPVVGDLVLLKNDILLNDEADYDDNSTENSEDKEDTNLVKVLQEEDLCHYTAFDIVLPLPGYNIVYPENMKSAYKELLEQHGLTLEMPKQKVRTYSLSGTYRKLFGEVKDLTWKIMYYDGENDSLIRSDLEELMGHEEPVSAEGGQFKALILNFSLNSSNYATMVLRELLKCDTSSSYQAKLNHNVTAASDTEPASTSDKPARKRSLDTEDTTEEDVIPSKCQKIDDNGKVESCEAKNDVQEESVMLADGKDTDNDNQEAASDSIEGTQPENSCSGSADNLNTTQGM